VSAEKTEGIVIRAVDFSESSRIVTLFTRDFGKLGAMAKGGRRLKGAFENALEPLSVCGIAVIRKPHAELDLLTEATLLERFVGLRSDLNSLYAAFYVAEALDGFLQRDDPHATLYEKTIDAIGRLARREPTAATLARYLGELTREFGFSPQFERCASCGADDETVVDDAKPALVSDRAGGVVCKDCRAIVTDARPLPANVVSLLRRWASADSTRSLASEPGDREAFDELAPIPIGDAEGAARFWFRQIEHHLGRRLRSSALIRFDRVKHP
jgi:DNA repair protein RecO (recombination protein O)